MMLSRRLPWGQCLESKQFSIFLMVPLSWLILTIFLMHMSRWKNVLLQCTLGYFSFVSSKHFKQSNFCADISAMSSAIIITLCVVSIYQPVDELSEGLIWASREGCLEDVVFLLTTGVEVNSRGQVRLRMLLSGGMSNGAIFSPYLHCYTSSPGFSLGLPHPQHPCGRVSQDRQCNAGSPGILCHRDAWGLGSSRIILGLPM